MENLKESYEQISNAYLQAFCEKHGYESGCLIDGHNAIIDDNLYLSFDDLRADIDMDAPADEFGKWNDYADRMTSLGAVVVSYQVWLKSRNKE